ncbi:kinase [Pedobacter faecalis]|uniref:kinase n=1 Tax=Pedobacter faecalis TaxID=3041495 RepID=UPI00254CC20B|nr:kinase [Pedobacter sp. ELA7]
MPSQILYYPYINLPRTDWTLRTLLYYDNVGSIVPQDYSFNPECNYEPFMLELVRENLVTPINPFDVLGNSFDLVKPFLLYINDNQQKIKRPQIKFAGQERKYKMVRIHSNKFDEQIFYVLTDMGLADRIDHQWYNVESNIGNYLMKYLASVISEKTNRLPTTDFVKPKLWRRESRNQKEKRETILDELIPFPKDINLKQLLKFKERHSDLLRTFRNEVEEITLDANILAGSPLFDVKLDKLKDSKKQLSAMMNESRFGDIIFGSVCGLIAAVQALPVAGTVGALITAAPAFMHAVHSVLQIERPENIGNQNGMKYLALMDKRIKG